VADATRANRVVALLAALAFAVPLGAIVVRAVADVWRAPALVPQEWGLRGFREGLSGGATAEAFANSLVVGALTTLVALVLAWPAARVLGERRLRRGGWDRVVFLLLALPLLVPPYATGAGLAEPFIRLGLIDTRAGLVLAHLTAVLPYVVLVLLGGFGARLAELEDMGRALGLSPLRRLAWVTVPAVRPTLAAAAALGFLVSWSQYGSSLAVGGGIPMAPLVLLPFVGPDPQVAAAVSTLYVLPALLALAVAARAARSPL
jgi:putative spermidine/putrescine transport system permease protein